jgi:phage terminase large subunit
MNVALPHLGWRPRDYQMPAWGALEAGYRRLALEWHRRAGKDDVCLHWAAISMMTEVGNYWHMLPQANQARKAIWDAVNPKTGMRRIDEAFPVALRSATRETDMMIRFRNGSTWQVVGSDNFNALVGAPPRGVVFSEYALSDPSSWAYLQPILEENGGWALFISTTRGRNHFSRLVDFAKTEPSWYAQTLTVHDTKAIPLDRVEAHRKNLAAERGEVEADAIIAQEYYCDRNAALPGAYYGQHMSRAERDGRIGDYPWIPSLPVGTAWDIGSTDSTVIWFFQQLRNGRIRLIDVLEGSGVGVDWYAAKLREREYAYAEHIWPRDGDAKNIRDIGGNTLKANATTLGVRPIRVLDQESSVMVGINAVRQIFPLLEFNATPLPFRDETPAQAKARMDRAMDAMRAYRRVWNDKSQRFDDHPLHDWTSNTADSMRYLARGRRPFFSAEDRANRATVGITDD